MSIVKLFSPVGALLGLIMFYINRLTNNYGLTLLVFSLIVKVLMIPLGMILIGIFVMILVPIVGKMGI